MKKIKKVTISVLMISVLMLASLFRVYSASTDYIDKDKKKEEGIGVAVIKKQGIEEVYSYFYLFYDSKGEVHVVQYIENPMLSEVEKDEKKWILKTDADNLKAKQLGAKEFYKDEESIKKEENKKATELYKKIVKEKDSAKTLYDYIEGSEEDSEPYTIESIIFNDIQLFDVNVFSDTAAGREINEDSTVGIIRKLVAVWYYSFRNVALVILAILIIYYGIRMAISTVASDKAVYKQMLFGWLKSLVLILVVHYIMYIILSVNEYFVGIFKEINEDEGKIYNTIKTRALELPWKISIPATIMYITLLIMWIRFLWAYTKRLFTVMFLIILAPFVLCKYAFESATGRGSQMVSNWLQKFATSVFIQTIHAMIYVVFVRTALEIALDDLHGFVIALFFLNFILSADTIFMKIFKFEFSPRDIEDMKKPFKFEEQLIGAQLSYRLAKNGINFVTGTGATVVGIAGNEIEKGYIKATDALDDRFGGNHRRDLRDNITGALDTVDDMLIFPDYDENGNPIALSDGKAEVNRLLRLRKLSRVRGMTGATNKKRFKVKLDHNKKKFTSNFKIIKDIGVGTAETIFAIPVGVFNPTAGIAMAVNSLSRFSTSHQSIRNAEKQREKERKYNKYIDSTLRSVRTIEFNSNSIEKKFSALSQDERQSGKQQLIEVNGYDINQYSLQTRINEYVVSHGIEEIDEDTLRQVVSNVVDQLPDTLSDADKQLIKELAIQNIQRNRLEADRARQRTQQGEETEAGTRRRTQADPQTNNNNNDDNADEQQENTEQVQNAENQGNNTENQRANSREKTTYSFAEISEGIEDATIETKVDNRFAESARALNRIKDANDREQGRHDTNGTIKNVNKFIESL